MKEFKCKDAGHACDWKIRDVNEERILEQAKAHGTNVHGLLDPRDEQIRPLIHDIA